MEGHKLLTEKGFELFNDLGEGHYQYMKKVGRCIIKLFVVDTRTLSEFPFGEIDHINVSVIDVHRGKIDDYSFRGNEQQIVDNLYRYIEFF